MSNDLSSLTADHVQQLAQIIGTLEQSTFDYLQLEVGDLKVTIGKGAATIPDAPPPSPAATPVSAPAPAPQPSAPPPAPAATLAAAGTSDVVSPIMGMFYLRPEPGADPFVAVGTAVAHDTTVGLVEVMKTFNAVTAGVGGTIVEVCAPDAQLVEYGQVLFRVAPQG